VGLDALMGQTPLPQHVAKFLRNITVLFHAKWHNGLERDKGDGFLQRT